MSSSTLVGRLAGLLLSVAVVAAPLAGCATADADAADGAIDAEPGEGEDEGEVGKTEKAAYSCKRPWVWRTQTDYTVAECRVRACCSLPCPYDMPGNRQCYINGYCAPWRKGMC